LLCKYIRYNNWNVRDDEINRKRFKTILFDTQDLIDVIKKNYLANNNKNNNKMINGTYNITRWRRNLKTV